jgi:hypothetical protein
MPASPAYDLGKWMNTMKDIYVKMHLGASENESIEQSTNGWNTVEKREFLNWMKYYKSGDHRKYKTAQHSYYVNEDVGGYFMPNPKGIPSPISSLNKQIETLPEVVKATPPPEPSKEEKQKAVEDLRRKLMGRLNSTEKLLTSQQGRIFAGDSFARLLKSLHELKQEIQFVSNINASAQTCVDLIIRQANILQSEGFTEPSQFMVKLAQNVPGNYDFNLGSTPAGGSQPDAGGNLGNPNAPTNADISTPAPAAADLNAPADSNAPAATPPDPGADPNAAPAENGPADAPDPEDLQAPKTGVSGFLERMENVFTLLDVDKNEVEDGTKDEVIVEPDEEILEQEIDVDDDNHMTVALFDPDMVVVAQTTLPRAEDLPTPEATEPVPKQQNLEVDSPAAVPQDNMPAGNADAVNMTTEQAQAGPDVDQAKNDFDALIDSAFANLSVSDVVAKLESVNKIFRNREISRQLAIVDVMLDRLGLASYFPTLAEATNKQLEANQYCLTRIEDILSKLRGSIQSNDDENIELGDGDQAQNPGAKSLQQNFEQAEKKEKAKKNMRKQVEDKEMFEKAKPELEVENVPEDIAAQPAPVVEQPLQRQMPVQPTV